LKNKMENFIQQNFIGVWHHFLYFEIKRSNFAVETFGSANAYLIFQVIAWHHILVMIDQAEAKVRKEAVELWFKLTETGFKTVIILTHEARYIDKIKERIINSIEVLKEEQK